MVGYGGKKCFPSDWTETRDKLIQRYETRDLQGREIVYIIINVYISRIYALGGFVEERNFVFRVQKRLQMCSAYRIYRILLTFNSTLQN